MSLISILILALACKPRSRVDDAGSPTLAGAVDAGAARPLQLQIEVNLLDGGIVREALSSTASPQLPVTQALVVVANLPLHNYRLRILDELDRALASDDTPEETGSSLRYRIALLSPLRAGHRYTVLLDPQRGATLDDGSGFALDEQRLDFRTEGEREKETPGKRSLSKRHHRRDGT